MADYTHFQWGGVTFPMGTSLANPSRPLLRDADPALYWALQYWQAMIIQYMGARLIAEVGFMTGLPIASAVLDTAHFDPTPYLLDHPEFKFPLLAAYRVEDTFGQRTVTWENTTSQWEVTYVLPRLHWAGARRFIPFLHAVTVCLDNRTTQGFDASYLNGAQVWGAGYANLESIGFTSARYGRFDDADGVAYYSVSMRATVKERVMPVSGDLSTFAGAASTLDIRDAETASTLEDAIDMATEMSVPKSIAGVLRWFRADLGIQEHDNEHNTFRWKCQKNTADTLEGAGFDVDPILVKDVDAFSGRPGVRFGPPLPALQVPFLESVTGTASAQPYTLYAVFRAGDATDDRTVCYDVSTGIFRLYVEQTTGKITVKNAVVTTLQSLGTFSHVPAIVSVVMNGVSSALYVNAITVPDDVENIGGGTLSTYTRYGAHQPGSLQADPLEGELAEFAMFAGAHDDATRATMMTYLGERYGIAIAQ